MPTLLILVAQLPDEGNTGRCDATLGALTCHAQGTVVSTQPTGGRAGVRLVAPLPIRGELVAPAAELEGALDQRLAARGRWLARRPVLTAAPLGLRLSGTAAPVARAARVAALGVAGNPGEHVVIVETEADEDTMLIVTGR